MNWLMSLGLAGMVLGVLLLIALVVLAVFGIARAVRGSRP